MQNDEQFYAAVADEIARGYIDKVLWTKAFANSGGEEVATKSLYCRLRAEQLQSASEQQHRSIQIAFTKEHAKQLGFGLLVFIIGIALTAASYSAVKPGGHYIITYGLIVGGFVAICRGFSGLVRTQFIRPTSSAADSFPHPPGTNTTQGATTASQPSEQTTTTAPPPLPTQATQIPKSNGDISTPVGCLIIIVATVVIGAFMSAHIDSPPPATTVYPTPAPTIYPAPLPPTPSLSERRAKLNKTFIDLEAEYHELAARRSNLTPNDSAKLEAFNRDAADYTRRVEQAHAEKAQLEQ